MDLTYRCRNGTWRTLEARGWNLVHEPQIGGIVLNTRDITERALSEAALRESEERFRALSVSSPVGIFVADRLGQLRYANPRLTQTWDQHDGSWPAVLFTDLDDFKTANDPLGHEFGDRLLRLVATRLRQATRPTDTVARRGGDEFAVLIEGLAHDEGCMAVAQRVVELLSEPFELDGHTLRIGASVGVARRALAPGGGQAAHGHGQRVRTPVGGTRFR